MGSDERRYTGNVWMLVIWSAGVGGMGVVAAAGRAWFFTAWSAALLVAGLAWMFVSVTLDADAIELRGAFRRRSHLVSHVVAVERWPTSVVFRFDRGSAMVLPLRGGDLDVLVAQLRALNPSIRRGGLGPPTVRD